MNHLHSSIIIVAPALLILLTGINSDDWENSTEKLPSGFRKGRWGIFFTYEPVCTLACRANGKFSGRMYGGVCRCYCPRLEQDPCGAVAYPSCDRFCRQNNYPLGGDCLDETNCYCNCTVRQRQSPNGTTTTAPPPCGGSSSEAPGTEAPPSNQAPAPGSLGINQGGGTLKNHRHKQKKPGTTARPRSPRC